MSFDRFKKGEHKKIPTSFHSLSHFFFLRMQCETLSMKKGESLFVIMVDKCFGIIKRFAIRFHIQKQKGKKDENWHHKT